MEVLPYFVLALFVPMAQGYSCTYSFGGNNYDASPLAKSSSDYNFTAQGNDFYVNMCQPVVNQLCGSDSAACEQWDPTNANGKASLGAADTATFGPSVIPGENGQGFTVKFVDGDIPPGGTTPRSMEIDFTCDSTAGIGQPSYQGEQPQLHFNFQWRSLYASATTACSTLGTCTECTADSTDNCLWCLDSSSCLQGPVGTNATCNNWVQDGNFCPAPKCSQGSNCGTCTGLGGCGWCLNSNACIGLPTNSTVCRDLVTAQAFCPNAEKPFGHKGKVVIN